jgi:cell division protease FtsH
MSDRNQNNRGGPNNNNQNNQNKGQLPGGGWNLSRFTWLIVVMLLLLPFLNFLFMRQGSNVISYTRFKELVSQGNVAQVVMERDTIEGTLKQQMNIEGNTTTNFITYLPATGDDELLNQLEQQNVNVVTRSSDAQGFWTVLGNLIPILLLVWIGVFMWRSMRQRGQGMFSVGENKAKLYDKSNVTTTFGDVAGLDAAKEEIMDIVDFLKNPDKYHKLGARPSRGILLVGAPGTGKTLVARAVAGEAGVPFYSTSGSDFMEMFVGVGASRVRNMFKDARNNSPSIIFIDELDSIGRHRGAGLGGGHDEREQTLNQLLSELDGFEQNSSTIVIAATNRPDILDPALKRPGRFDREITVNLPTLEDRLAILNIHAKKKPIGESVDMRRVAQGVPGFSGADLENLLNVAAQIAARKNRDALEMVDIEEARDTILMGLVRSGVKMGDRERKMVAYHEAGHTLVAYTLPNTDPIHKVTIIPRGQAMGVTQQLPEEEQYLYEKKQMEERIAVLLGGRAAEHAVWDTMTSGAENDLQVASRMARKMITAWGMSDVIGMAHLQEQQGAVFLGEELTRGKQYSEQTAREVDTEIKNLVHHCYENAENILKERRAALDAITEALLEKEELTGEEIDRLIRKTEGTLEESEEPEEQESSAEEPASEEPASATASGSDSVPEEAETEASREDDGRSEEGGKPEDDSNDGNHSREEAAEQPSGESRRNSRKN